MKQSKKRWIIGLSVFFVLLTVTLVLVGLGFQRLKPYEIGLDYDMVTGTMFPTLYRGPGIYYISFTHRFVRFNRNSQSQYFVIQSLTSDQVIVKAEVRVGYALTTEDKAQLEKYYVNFGEQPLSTLRPIFSNAIHRALSSVTIQQLSSFNATSLNKNIETAIVNILNGLAPLNIVVTTGTLSSNYENAEQRSQLAVLNQQIESLQAENTSMITSSAEIAGTLTQLTTAAKNAAETRRILEENQVQRVTKMFGTQNSSLFWTERMLELLLSSNQTLFSDRLLPNYIRYASATN